MDVALQRLIQQRVLQNPLATPDKVVAWLGAVQAQDYPGAKWTLGLRMNGTVDAEIEQAFNAGSILRTHAMRPTWHFLTPVDIRWVQELTAPRVHAGNAYQYRQYELDQALFARSDALIARALEGGQHLTRVELGQALEKNGIQAQGIRLIYIVMHAELEALVCSGPRRGKQFTYALLAERASRAVSRPREEALAELTRRYFTGHGPATVRDFTWWSGLTAADAIEGLEMAAGSLSHAGIDGGTYWFSDAMPMSNDSSGAAFLLPTYDEFLVGYAAFDRTRHGGQAELVFNATLLNAGEIVGTWRRTFQKEAVVIEIAPFGSIPPNRVELIHAAARRYGDFLGMPVEIRRIPSA